jgi:hypothetical protein
VQKKDVALVRTFAESVKRTSQDVTQVAHALDTKGTADSLRVLTHPPSLNKTVRNVGIALALAPEPFTTAAGIAMIGGSYLMKSREPASLSDLGEAASTLLGDLSSISLAELSLQD